MSRSFLRIRNLTFRWPSQVDDLFTDFSITLESGWNGLVGENGCGKSTLLSLVSGLLSPVSGHIDVPGSVVLCEQRTDSIPEGFDEFICLPDAASGQLASLLGIEADWPWRWDTLSHGERKRAQIATALWMDPEVLMVDEPVNHLDLDSRRLLVDALERYRGIGVIVAHDRALLDRLCRQTLFLDFSGPQLRPGGVSAGLEEIEREALAAGRERDEALRELKRMETESRRRSREASMADRKRSKRHLNLKDSDGREKIDRARLSGKDGRAGELKRQLDDRVAKARGRFDSAKVSRRRIGGITLAGEAQRSDRIAFLPAGSLSPGEGCRISWPDLHVAPGDRIGLTGPNGAGKSCFLSELLQAAAIPASAILSIPQEISLERGVNIAAMVRELSRKERGEVFSTVDRLGSDPRRLMETESPSPGETRKLLLALGMSRKPSWIVMDEPTNHMDLFSVRHIEAALAGYGGALFLISHDRRFLEAVTDTEWRISSGGEVRPVSPQDS